MSFMENVFSILEFIDDFFWSYIGWALIVASGIFFTIYSKGLQFRALYHFKDKIREIYKESKDRNNDADNQGVNPFKLYFASVGGMVGLGNIVFISTAVMIGGPGSIFWIIIASISGMLIKYSEIYLGVKYRIKNADGTFSGGPMYFLQKAFGSKVPAAIFAVFMCLYGVEVTQFAILVDRFEYSFEINRYVIIFSLLALVLYSAMGGIKRLAEICSFIMPVFMILYIIIALYVIGVNYAILPTFFKKVLISAFTGHAPIGGFVGSTMVLSAYLGVSKAVYSGDIGIGYDSIVQSETKIVEPQKQATLAIYALVTDTIICLLTCIMIGITGTWFKLNGIEPSQIVSTMLSEYIPYSDSFITCLTFFAGFTTVIAYLTTGTKCAQFLSPKYGKTIYLIYAIFGYIFFCNFSQMNLIILMGVLSGSLMLINVCGMFILRKEVDFS